MLVGPQAGTRQLLAISRRESFRSASFPIGFGPIRFVPIGIGSISFNRNALSSFTVSPVPE